MNQRDRIIQICRCMELAELLKAVNLAVLKYPEIAPIIGEVLDQRLDTLSLNELVAVYIQAGMLVGERGSKGNISERSING